jgi:hypothetical protein
MWFADLRVLLRGLEVRAKLLMQSVKHLQQWSVSLVTLHRYFPQESFNVTAKLNTGFSPV